MLRITRLTVSVDAARVLFAVTPRRGGGALPPLNCNHTQPLSNNPSNNPGNHADGVCWWNYLQALPPEQERYYLQPVLLREDFPENTLEHVHPEVVFPVDAIRSLPIRDFDVGRDRFKQCRQTHPDRQEE